MLRICVRVLLRCNRREEEDELSANSCACGQLGAEFADGTAEELFVELGEFAGEDDGLCGAECGLNVGEGVEDAVRGFVEDVGCGIARGLLRGAGFALRRLWRGGSHGR